MPLYIHPSSCCDVCLDPFTYDDPKPPNALPCGHIFCKECLDNVRPCLCPVCRRRYHPTSGARKLITGELDDRKPMELLEKLILRYDEDPHTTEVREVRQEIDQWFGTGKSNRALSQGRRLVEEWENYFNENRGLRGEIRRRVRQNMNDTETTNVMIASLHSRVEELERHVFYMATLTEPNVFSFRDLDDYKEQVEDLELELQSHRGHNPLPRPPRDYRLDYFPNDSGVSHRSNNYGNGYSSETSSSRDAPAPLRITDGKILGSTSTTPPSAHPNRKGKDREPDYAATPVPSTSRALGNHVSPSTDIASTPTPPRPRPDSATRITIHGGSDSKFLPSGPRMNGEYGGQVTNWAGTRPQGRSVSDPFGPTTHSLDNGLQSREEDPRRQHRRQDSYPSHTGASFSSQSTYSMEAEPSRRNNGLSSFQLLDPPQPEPAQVRPRLTSSNWIQESRSMRQPYVAVHHTSNAVLTAPEPPPQPTLHRSFSTSQASSGRRPTQSALRSAPLTASPAFTTESASTRPRSSRRSTVQNDNELQAVQPDPTSRYLPTTATMAAPVSEDHNGRFAPLPITRPLPDSANSSRRSSVMSWGDTRSFVDASPSRLPIPDYARLRRADDIDSVSDLPLSWFPESTTSGNEDASSTGPNGVTYQVADISTATEAMSAMAFYNRQLAPDDGPTPRSRPESLLEDHFVANTPSTQGDRRSWDSRSQYIPHSIYQATVPEQEHAAGTYPRNYDFDPPSHHETIGSTITPGPTANPDTHMQSGSTLPSRSSRQHLHPSAEDDSPSPDPWWTNIRRHPQPTDDANALGLSDLATSPQISAPTPITPSHSFLRTYSYDTN